MYNQSCGTGKHAPFSGHDLYCVLSAVCSVLWGGGTSEEDDEMIGRSLVVKELCAKVCVLPRKQKGATEVFQQEGGASA